MMGHILEWLYKELLEISSVRDAYKEILIAPGCSGLIQRVIGSHRSARGEIKVDFKSEMNGLRLAVSLPPNTSGIIKLPIESDETLIMESDILINIESVQEHGGLFAVIRISSGSYQFAVRESAVMNWEDEVMTE